MRISQTMWREANDPSKATLSPHNNSYVTGRVESDAERMKWIRLSGYVKRYKRCVRRTAHNSGGPIRFGPDQLGSGCSVNVTWGVWPIPEWHVMYLMRISQTMQRDESVPTKATLSPHDNSDATGRVKSDAERSKWIRLSGYVKRYKRCVHRTAQTQAVRFGSVLIGSARVAVWMTPKASGQFLHDTSCI